MRAGLTVALAVGMGRSAAAETMRLTDAYFYDRAIVAETVMLDAIGRKLPKRIVTVYDGLVDEYDVLSGSGMARPGEICFEAMAALIPVTLMAFGRVTGSGAPVGMVDSSWADYRATMAQCEKQAGVQPRTRNLPERLSEVF